MLTTAGTVAEVLVAKWLACLTEVRGDPNSNDTAGGCLSRQRLQYAAFGTGCTGRYCSAQVNPALHSSGVAKSSTSFGWGKGGKVTSARWQVTLCDPIWHVSSRSGVVTLHCELLYSLHLPTVQCTEYCYL